MNENETDFNASWNNHEDGTGDNPEFSAEWKTPEGGVDYNDTSAETLSYDFQSRVGDVLGEVASESPETPFEYEWKSPETEEVADNVIPFTDSYEGKEDGFATAA